MYKYNKRLNKYNKIIRSDIMDYIRRYIDSWFWELGV
jgi:hypothetical protein